MANDISKPTSTSRLTDTLARLSSVQKIAIGAAALTLAGGLLMMSRSGSVQAMSPLYTDLDPKDAAAVTDGLTSRSIEYELADGGRTVLVPKDSVYEMRVALSADGLPSSNEGYALLDRQGITTSEFRQRVDYQRALEGELAMTLEAIDGIDSATVHLALPEESVFIDEPADPTASVLVSASPSAAIDNAQVSAMVHLVASSVKGMKPENVTIADAAGNVLASGDSDGVSADSVGGDARSDSSRRFEEELSTRLRAMIGRVTGVDKVAVTVRADLDLTAREATSEVFDTSSTGPGVVVAERTASESYVGEGASAPLEAGVLGPDGSTVTPDAATAAPVSTPPAVSTPSTTPTSGSVPTTVTGTAYNKAEADRTFAVNRTVESVSNAPGEVQRLHVAVLVDEAAVTAEQATAIEQMVTTASGIDSDRGDTVTVTRLAFDTSSADQVSEAAAATLAAEAAASRNSLIRTAAIALISLIAIILAFVSTRKARREVATPIDVNALRTAAVPGFANADGAGGADTSANRWATASRSALDELSVLADRNPEDVAQILQGWLTDEVPV
jgi:flagellar M-ring protein FliF